MKLTLGSRASTLAMARANQVAAQLRGQGHEVEIVAISQGEGDSSHMPGRIQEQSEYASELREALRTGQVDVVVHSVKDIPLGEKTIDGLRIAAYPKRDDWRDVLVSLGGLTLGALPRRSRVGVTSLRRVAQLRTLRDDLIYLDVRGTLSERLARVQPGDLDALVVSSSSLGRLGIQARISEYLPILPAAGQGAIALECRSDDTAVAEALEAIDHEETAIAVAAERGLLGRLGSTYAAPIGAVVVRQGVLNLKAGVFAVDGSKKFVVELGMPTSMLHAARVGTNMAELMLQRGAGDFLTPEAIEAAVLANRHDEESESIDTAPADAPRVLLPRQEGRMSRALRECGLLVDTCGLQRAVLISADNTLDSADLIVVPSAITVWAMRERGWDFPEGVKIAAMGETTSQVLRDAGQAIDYVPEGTASSQRLVDLLPPSKGEKVIVAGSDQPNFRLEEGLREKGYEAERLALYTTKDLDEIDPWLVKGWRERRWDAALLSSPSMAGSFLRLLGPKDGVRLYCWDEETADVLRGAGVEVAGVAESKDEKGVESVANAIKAARSGS